ncbi:MAG: hypothetical protein AAFX06_20630 [Planctomycetota bacterium]
MKNDCRLSLFSFALIGILFSSVADADNAQLLKAIASADGSVASDSAAADAAAKLQQLPSSEIVTILKAFPDSTTRGNNWLRSLASDVADNGPFPLEALRGFFDDRGQDADARYVAYQLLTQNDSERAETLLASAETDPSLPVRYLKIESMLANAKEQPAQAESILKSVVANGRTPNQLERAAKALEDLGVKVDLASELALIRQWSLIGPFDNSGSQHFDTAYTVENAYLESGDPTSQKQIKGKNGGCSWQPLTSDDTLGMVDLNEPLSREKDAVAYVFAKFKLDDPTQIGAAEARLGCICANKVWVNGKLVISNDVYHSGSRIDQYIGNCELVAGENTVLVKVLQNAQTEPWAQDWEFQFRLTKSDGSAVNVSVQ